MTHRTTGYKIMLLLALRDRKARQAVKACEAAPLWMQDMQVAQLLAAKEIHREARKLYAKA